MENGRIEMNAEKNENIKEKNGKPFFLEKKSLRLLLFSVEFKKSIEEDLRTKNWK